MLAFYHKSLLYFKKLIFHIHCQSQDLPTTTTKKIINAIVLLAKKEGAW